MNRIKEIKQRLEELSPGKVIAYDNTMNLAMEWIGNYKNDTAHLLELVQKQRETLEKVYQLDGYLFVKEALGEDK
jgi:hypothetical protein